MASLFFMPVNHGGLNVENTNASGASMASSHYHGKPCKRCGGTLRYIRNRACMVCKNVKHTDKFIGPIHMLYGRPCRKCGGTLRYASDHSCAGCAQERNRIKAAKYKAKLADLPKQTPGSDRCLSCGETKNYFFLDYCRECRTAEKQRTPEPEKTYSRCEWCGEWKPYRITGACKTCEAAEKRRRAYWEAEDKLRAVEAAQRRYSDPF